jgi:hypothetical protein
LTKEINLAKNSTEWINKKNKRGEKNGAGGEYTKSIQ